MREQLERCMSQLPPISPVALEALQILGRPDVDQAAAAAMLGRDPMLTARVLRLANAPFYGCTGRIATVREAFLVLGTRTLYQTVLAAAVLHNLESEHNESERLWRHATATARAARVVGEARVDDPDLAATGALLHDLGRLVFGNCGGNAYRETVGRARAQGIPLEEAERAAYGTDHAEVGATVAARWRLPQSLIDVIGGHHTPDGGKANRLIDVVHVANSLAHALDDEEQYPVPIISENAWRRLALDVTQLPAMLQAVGVNPPAQC